MVLVSPQHPQQQQQQAQIANAINASLQNLRGSNVGTPLGSQLAIAAAAAAVTRGSVVSNAGSTVSSLSQLLLSQQQQQQGVNNSGQVQVGSGSNSAFQSSQSAQNKPNTLQMLQASLRLHQQQRQQQEQFQQQLQRLHNHQQQQQQQHHLPKATQQDSTMPSGVEKRRAATDDYVRLVRQHNLTQDYIDSLQIPVKKAFDVDPCRWTH